MGGWHEDTQEQALLEMKSASLITNFASQKLHHEQRVVIQ